MMKFRPQRGTFMDAMAELFVFDGSRQALEAHLGKAPLRTEPYGTRVDARAGWNARSFLVIGPDDYPVGYTDGMLSDPAIQAFIGNTLRTFDSVEALNAALVEDQKEQERQLAREVEEPPNE